MAEVRPLHAVHYNLNKVGGLDMVTSPPYDVIDSDLRAELVEKSPYNVVQIDLPQGEDRYGQAAKAYGGWLRDGILERDSEPAYWVLSQEYRAPDGQAATRHGLFCRVRVTEYGAGRIRPHERTHAGPIKDRLELMRATKANLSPIFSLYSDPGGDIWRQAQPATETDPWGAVEDGDGTVHKIWRLSDPEAVAEIGRLFEDRELLIADGHHRYETSLTYSKEIGGQGDHNYTLMCLVSIEDPGLAVFPTHRVLTGLSNEEMARLEDAVNEFFECVEAPVGQLGAPEAGPATPTIGFVSEGKPARRLTVRSGDVLNREMEGHSDAYKSLDTAVLEALVFKQALGAGQEELLKKRAITYSKNTEEAVRLVNEGSGQAAFIMGSPPIELVKQIAATGETMPPKSTYFYPKLLTGLLFSPLTK